LRPIRSIMITLIDRLRPTRGCGLPGRWRSGLQDSGRAP